MRYLALAVGIAFLAAFSAAARTIRVPIDEPTIQLGLDQTQPGDTVLVEPGTYFEHDIAMRNGVCLRSESVDPSDVVVDAQGNGTAISCVYLGSSTRIEGLTLARGRAAEGGGIYCLSAHPVISSCRLQDNQAENYGGGIFCNDSRPAIQNCVFQGNAAGASGGGISCYSGSSGTITGCLFEGNTAGQHGGGMLCYAGSSPLVEHCQFRDNVADWCGGGLLCWLGSSPSVRYATFAENHAGMTGGAVYSSDTSALGVASCTFWGNEATQGSSIFFEDAQLVVENSLLTFSALGAPVEGAGSGGASLTCCDVYGNVGGDWVGPIAGQNGISGNISEDPLFCGANGYDFTLQAGSPCAPEHNPACGLIGAWPVGCEGTPVEICTWGRIKAAFAR